MMKRAQFRKGGIPCHKWIIKNGGHYFTIVVTVFMLNIHLVDLFLSITDKQV